jgi:hypothetical protein
VSSPRNQRPKGGSTFRLVDRDLEIIRAVNRFRYLRTSQIHRLLFGANTSKQSCRRRLKYLWQNQYLDRIFPFIQLGVGKEDDGSSDVAYRLDKRGVQYLQDSDIAIPYPYRKRRVKHEFLQHALDLSEFRVNLELAVNALPNIDLKRFVPDFMQQEGVSSLTGYKRYRLYDEIRDPTTGEMVVFYPDAAFVLQVPGTSAARLYFLEIDRGTEGMETIRRKLRAYQIYARNKVFAKFGKFSSFTVLFQSNSPRRAKNLVRLLGDIETIASVVVTDHKQVTPDTVLTGKIWRATESEAINLIRPEKLLNVGN